MGTSLAKAMRKHDLKVNHLDEAKALDKTTIRHILNGESATSQSYTHLFKWLKENKPEVYKDAVNDYIKELSKFIVD